MTTINAIYQSGEKVSAGGVYEVVAKTTPYDERKRHRTLQTGDLFPNFDGRSVGWKLVLPAPNGTRYEEQPLNKHLLGIF